MILTSKRTSEFIPGERGMAKIRWGGMPSRTFAIDAEEAEVLAKEMLEWVARMRAEHWLVDENGLGHGDE